MAVQGTYLNCQPQILSHHTPNILSEASTDVETTRGRPVKSAEARKGGGGGGLTKFNPKFTDNS